MQRNTAVKRETMVDELTKENAEFRKLFKEHQELETQLQTFDTRIHLTSDEEIERKRIQKLKLSGKDRMEEIIRAYEQGATT